MALTKRRLLAVASALSLAGGVTAVAVAVAGQPGTARRPAAASTGAVHAQRVDVDTSDSPAPQFTFKVPFTLRIANYGGFIANVCVENSDNGEQCSPNMTAPDVETLSVTLPANKQAHLHASGQLTFDGAKDAYVYGGTHCFRFDGTIFKYTFKEVDCEKL